MSRLLLAILAAIVLTPAGVAAAACTAPSGESITFNHTGDVQQVQVPAGVRAVNVHVRGGHGGRESSTAQGGQGGTVWATVDVQAGECLDIYVGGYGGGHGGWGWGHGGAHGETPNSGKDGAGGGGGSAIVLDGHALVVAGGGGGGGGKSASDHRDGGQGGDGANGDGADTAIGSDGYNPPNYPQPVISGEGGIQSGKDGADGGGFSGFGFRAGAGGGGGGGAHGGSGGSQALLPDKIYSTKEVGGGGGGGGSSAVAADKTSNVTYGVEGVDCSDGHEADCHGVVTLTWVETPAKIRVQGGSGQSAVIGTRFTRPLQALVTSASGIPVPDVDVTFTLPASGPSATFDVGTPELTATARTDGHGIATSPPLIAGLQGGGWVATATAAGVGPHASFSIVNAPATTMVALFTPRNPAVSGEPLRFSAAVGAAPSAAGTPTGTVQFLVDGDEVGLPIALDSSGIAQSDPVTLTRGDHTISAQYGDGASFKSSDATITQSVDKGTSLVEVSSSANPAPDGDPITFTARVSGAPPSVGTPSGTVQFRVDGADVGAPVDLAGGVAASAPVTGLAAGPHQIDAVYSGDDAYGAGSATLEQAVGADATAVEIGLPSAPTPYGDPATVTATLHASGGTPTGAVTFAVDGTTACGDVAVDGSGQASCVLPSTLEPGRRIVTAHYAGDGTFAAADGRAEHLVVPAQTSVSVSAVPSPSVFGQTLSIHADVAAVSPGAGTPDGAVQFVVDGIPVGPPAPLEATGATSEPIVGLGAGPHLIEASYSGGTRFHPSDDQLVTAVDPAETVATLSSSAPVIAPPGTPMTFSVRVAGIAPGGATPTGTVRFSVDGAASGAAVRLRDGVATSDPATLAEGTHDIRASFAGDDDWGSSEATLEQIVAPAIPTGGGGGGSTAPVRPPAGGGDSPLVPTIPAPTPSTELDRVALCGAPFVVTQLQIDGRRLRVAGMAQPELAGRRVAVARGDERLLRTIVREDGSFSASKVLPRGRNWKRATVRVTVGADRSPRMRLARAVRLGAPTAGADQVRVAVRGPRGARLVLEGRTRCGAPMQRERTVRLDRRGRATLTLERPAAGEPEALYRVRKTGRHAVTSLPAVVRPR
jgi:hypothetical protein